MTTSWRYQVLRQPSRWDGEDEYGLIEVYSNNDDEIEGWATADAPVASDRDELIKMLTDMLADAQRFPVLAIDEDTGEPVIAND